MSNAIHHWLDEHIRPPRRLGARVLVLCRDRATVSLVRRWAAARGGVHGVEIATPATLAAQVWRGRTLTRTGEEEIDEGELPADCEAARFIGPRPGLVAVARRWVRWLRIARSAGHPAPAPPWLEELAELGWAVDHEEQAITHLVNSATERGLAVGEAAWSRAIALGFIDGSPFTAPWETKLLQAFGAVHAELPEPGPPRTVPALTVPDVVAEARSAVRFAAASPEDTLVLVANDATARRVRDALTRNGIGCDWRGALPLRGHVLSSVVSRSAAWFESTDPWIQVSDLATVFRQVAFGRSLHPAAQALLEHRLATHGLSPEDAWLDRRALVRLLEHVRLLEAPLSQWLARLQSLSAAPADDPRTRRRAAQAAALEVRLQLLAAAVSGEPVERALGHQAPLDFDSDDFDAIVAELLGEDVGVDAPETAVGTLGAVRGFLLACRVDVQDDPLARAVLGALGRRAHWPASPAHVAHALAGAVDPGSLVGGVQVCTYAEWDGRPARRVLLLDVHDKGLGRRPAPDPLLTDPEIRALGAVPPSQWTEQVLGLALRAVRGAEEALAIVSRHDADGRSVVPPVQLELAPVGSEPVPSYGIGPLDLPEACAFQGLQAGVGAPIAPPRLDDPWPHLAAQATVEWYREGRGPRPSERPATEMPPVAPLSEWLDADGARWPAYLEPWLGTARGVPEAALPPGPFSATGMFTAVSHCMYQAFGRYVLTLQPVEEVTDDLDPREVGTAVHEAIQRASPQAPWRVPAAEREAAASTLVRALEAESREAFAQATANLGALSPARTASAQGRLERWHKHWPAFAASRLGDPPPLKQYDQLKQHPAFLRAIDTIKRLSPPAATVNFTSLCKWLEGVARQGADAVLAMHPDLQLDSFPQALPASMLPDLPAILAHEHVTGLKQVFTNLQWRASANREPVAGMGAEVPFGPDAGAPADWIVDGEVVGRLDLGPVEVPLGAGPVPVRGQIDRLLAVSTRHGTLLEITDYKTGRARPGWSFRRALHQLSDPQLLVYAMVMEQVRDRPDLPASLAGARVASVSWDHVRATYAKPTRRESLTVPDTVLWVDRDILERGREALGSLLDRGRASDWPLRPRADTCPKLQSWGHDYCPFSDVCRFRALPAAPRSTP